MQNSMWAPATFEHTAKGDESYTWRSPDGNTTHRIDYVCVPAKWRSRSIEAHVDYEFDTLLTTFDHVPAFLTVKWTNEKWDALPKRRGRVCDPRGSFDP